MESSPPAFKMAMLRVSTTFHTHLERRSGILPGSYVLYVYLYMHRAITMIGCLSSAQPVNEGIPSFGEQFLTRHIYGI